MPLEVRKEWFTVEQCRAEPEKLFVFGDNFQRKGKGGQAIIRDEPNAFGIVTKWSPNNYPDSFMIDDNYFSNIAVILHDFRELENRLECGVNPLLKTPATVIWPADGIGTGRANLPLGAPKTYQFLTSCVSYIMNKYGVTNKFKDVNFKGDDASLFNIDKLKEKEI